MITPDSTYEWRRKGEHVSVSIAASNQAKRCAKTALRAALTGPAVVIRYCIGVAQCRHDFDRDRNAGVASPQSWRIAN